MKILASFGLLLLLILNSFGAKPAKPTVAPPSAGTITLNGTLFPEVTDSVGNVKSVYLSVVDKSIPEGGTEYSLEGDPKAKDFVKLVYQSLEITGSFFVNKEGRKVLKIQQFRVLENKPQDIEEEF